MSGPAVSELPKADLDMAVSSSTPVPPLGKPALPLPEQLWIQLAAAWQLSRQQTRIVELILQGMCDKQIAAAMDLKVPTVRTYLDRIFARVEVGDRVELILRILAASHGLDRPVS
jgi:DNA-binding NarL/FixJ family response regulator